MVEVDDQYVLFAVVGHHSIPQNHQHKIEDGVEVLVHVSVKGKSVHAHDH